MSEEHSDMAALARALEVFTKTTQSMEEAYRRLEARVDQLDRELAQKNRELALTTDYLSNLLESISDGCIAVDREGCITRFNRAAGTILGYSAREVTGRPFEKIFGRGFKAPKLPGELELKSKSGRAVPVSERDSPVAGPDGRELGTVKTFQDLSELTALREQVRQIDRLAAVGEMAATVAHEIRNPLGGIRGFASFLAQDIPEDDPRARLVHKIQEGARRLDRVVSELLEFTRPVDLTLRPAGCRELVVSAFGYLEGQRGQVRLEESVPGDLRVLADQEKIGQVLLNIVLNAVQSVSGEGTVRVTAAADESYVDILVRDTGCGMDEDQRSQVFSPFFTTKEKGTGLGLAVSLKIVEGHGGSIAVESAPGEGAEFTVRLPRAE